MRKVRSYSCRGADIVPVRSIFLMYEERTKSLLYTSFCFERAKRVSKATVLYNVGEESRSNTM